MEKSLSNPALLCFLALTAALSTIFYTLIIAAWHVLILLFANYNSGTLWWFALPCFAVMVVSLSVILAWLRLKSNSVWPCAILHASHILWRRRT